MDTNLPNQETAELALMMEREIDKRVAVAVYRMFDPIHTTPMGATSIRTLESTFDAGNYIQARNMMTSLLVTTLLSDGSLMNEVRRKIAEQLQRNY